ncbi:MAG: acyltransferase domain-containing protein [Polyangiaceae bacterium]|jgi:acyl transferase domain-containing protein|nr:acyltransferase domain-containing protein [Polyangiaceae bacterium]
MVESIDAADVAIIGMAGRFPGARDVDELWRNVAEKVESIRQVTEDECRAAGLDPTLVRDPSFVRRVAELEDVEGFDAAFFDVPPREAELSDPQHRAFLECAWAALEHAGYAPRGVPGRVGVFGGATLSTYLVFNVAASGAALGALDHVQINLGNAADFLVTRVSYKLDLRGPSHAVQSACSTSLVAVHVACQSLLNGECDLALAGGASINVGHRSGYRWVKGGMTSPDGRCRAFDAGAQGTIFSSGVGVVVLKPLRVAVKDGDFVHAVIKGSAINNDGAGKAGFTAPGVEGQAKAVAEAMATAGACADSIGYVEAHGTATPIGDPIEVEALTRAFRASTARLRYCALGSLKTNVGHLDAAAGVAALIKVAQALKHRQLPPSLHFERPNPQIDFASSPFYVNTELKPWPAGATPRRAGVSSFGVGGTNAHAVLEEPPPTEAGSESRPWQLLVLSARSAPALDAAASRLADHLEASPEASLPDVAYTLQVGRQRFAHRRFIVCRDVPAAARALRELPVHAPSDEARADRPVAFLFPGQGAQRLRMAAEAYAGEPMFRAEVDRCAEMLRPRLGLDLREALYPRPELAEETTARLAETELAQPALFVVEYALARLWMSWGVTPQAMLGHSVGEYVAACLAGVFDLPSALELVAARGRLMQDLPRGAMLAVPLSEEELEPYLRGELALAAVNAPTQCVLAGPPGLVNEAETKLAAAGIVARRLPSTRAFHSPIMRSAAPRLTELARAARPRPPERPFLSNVTGTWITPAEATDPEYWGEHLCRPVRFAEGLAALLGDERRLLLEVGPGRTLSRLAQRHPAAPGATVIASLPDEGPEAGAPLVHALGRLWQAGAAVDWGGFARAERRKRVPLPTYPFERRRYWIDPPGASVRPGAPLAEGAPPPASSAPPAPPISSKHPRPSTLNAPYVAPVNAFERSLAELWEQALGIAPIGAQDNFFELGGDSLVAVQLSARIQQELGIEVPAVSLYEGLTVRSLANTLRPEPGADERADDGTGARERDRGRLAMQRSRRRRDDGDE